MEEDSSSKILANNKININNNTNTNMISSFIDTIEDMKTLSLSDEKEHINQQDIQLQHKMVSVKVTIIC